MKTCSRVLRTSDWCKGSPFNRTTTLSTQPRQRKSDFGIWPCLLEIPENSCAATPSNLTELERICREEREKLPKNRCAKFVALYPRKLEAVIAAKGYSSKY